MPTGTTSIPSQYQPTSVPLARSSPALADYLQLGDHFTAKQHPQLAEEAYSRGLSTSPPPSSDRRLSLLLGRAAARLDLHSFKPAYRDAVEALALFDSSTAPDALLPSLSRRGQALLFRAKAEEGLQLYSIALASYEETLALSSVDEAAKEGRLRILRRLEEAEEANYDWSARFQLGLDVHAHPRQDAADFLGPWKVERIAGRGGGRGAVATRDIKPGELLLVEKAFAIVYPWEVEGGDVDGEIVQKIVRKLEEDGSLARGMMSLYAGPAYPPPMSAPAGLSFATKLTSNSSATLDPRRIRGICEYNCFGASPVLPASSSIASSSSSPTALYTRAAFFNHSCAPNAIWRTYSDILVLRARTAIKEGDEIYHSYTSAIPGTEAHRTALKKHFDDGQCVCELCEEEREHGAEERRELLEGGRYEELQALVREQQAATVGGASEAVRSYTEALEATFKPRQGGHGRLGKLRPALHAVYHLMAEASWGRSVEEGLKWELAAFEAQGGILDLSLSPFPSSPPSPAPPANSPSLLASSIYNSTLGTMQLLLCAMRSQQAGLPFPEIQKWVRLALENERILGGAGRKLREVQYGEMIARMGLDEMVRKVDVLE